MIRIIIWVLIVSYTYIYTRGYIEVCDKLCVEIFYKNLLKPETHINNNPEGKQLKDIKKSCYKNMYWHCDICDKVIMRFLEIIIFNPDSINV